jgi:hypothetical protein
VFNPVSNEWDWNDGTGAEEIQVKAGSSPADLANINKGALSMAYPKAESEAIKEASFIKGSNCSITLCLG